MDGGKITGKNNIVYYNTADVEPEWGTAWGGGQIDLTYSASSKKLTGTGNITGKPLFVNSASDDFHLKIGSPCIDKGDPASPNDPDGTPADMGALFINQGTGIGNSKETIAETGGFKVKANVCNSSVVFDFQLVQVQNVKLLITNVAGKKVNSLFNGRMAAGTHTVKWCGIDDDGRKVPAGIYFVRLDASSNRQVEKVVFIR